MKVIGMNNKEITKILLMMYIPVVLLFLLLGFGLVFGLTQGLQAIVYTVTSVFITKEISAAIFIGGFMVILMIFALSILFICQKLGKKQISTVVKF